MADYSLDQKQSIRQFENAVSTLLDQLAYIKVLRQESIDKGYTPGTAITGITDAVVQAVSPQLVAADITAGFSTANTIDTTLAASSRAGYISLEKLRP